MVTGTNYKVATGKEMSFQRYDWPSYKVIYAGKSGCGKTTKCWNDFSEIENARVKVIYDHKAMEFCRRYKLQPIFSEAAFYEAVVKGGIVPFVPSQMFPGDAETGFQWLCEVMFKLCEEFPGRKLFLADELQKLVSTKAEPRALLGLCDIGQTYQIDCFFLTSASNGIHNRVLGQITECFAFQHGNDNACNWENDFGFNNEELFGLKKGEWLWRNDSGKTDKGGKSFQ